MKAHGPEWKDRTEMQTSVGGQQWTQTGETSQEYVKARSLTAAGFVTFRTWVTRMQFERLACQFERLACQLERLACQFELVENRR